MPHITTAMRWSVRRGVGDIFFESLLGKRVSIGGVDTSTFSSWDSCMAKTYCKWPVIAGIIVGGLIVLSILICIIRCACCGMSCCCTCFRFLECCDCCGGCCDGKKNKPHKHLDDPFSSSNIPPQQGYTAPAPMMGGALATSPPQFAQFEVGKGGFAVDPAAKINEDALPPMPSWETASKKHVLTEEEKNAVELGELDPATGQKIPLMAGGVGISAPPSPAHEISGSPYGQHPGQGVGGNGYMGVPGEQYAPNQSGYDPNERVYNPNGRGGYGGGLPGQAMGGRGYRPGSPRDMNGAGRGYGPPSPQDPYGNDNDNGFVGTAVGGGYSRSQPQRQQTPNGSNRPFPPQSQRQYSNDSQRPLNGGYSDRPYPPDNYQQNGPPRGPSRGRGGLGGSGRMASPPQNNSGFDTPDNYQQTGALRGPPRGPGRMASPALNNNSGFDFGTGSQPQQQYSSQPPPPPQQHSYGPPYAGSTAPPSYASRSPPPQEQSYPGYSAYQAPSNQGRDQSRGPPRDLMPRSGRGNGRQPENWDPVQR